MSKTRLAIVGYGRFGRVHARRARLHPAFEVCCIVEPDPQARLAAQADGFDAVANLQELPAGIEAASVITPSETHAEIAIALMRLGIDVLVEKPFATSERAIDAMLEAAQATGRRLYTGHIERFNHALASTPWREGAPDRIEFERRSRLPARADCVVLDLMVHDLDLASHLLAAPAPAAFEIVDVQQHCHGVTAELVIGATPLKLCARHGAPLSAASLLWRHGDAQHTLSLCHHLEPGQDDPLTRQYTAFRQQLDGQPSPIASAWEGAMAARRAIAIAARL
ncbi:MAG: Gfo/Idh/MocA family protein [Comamonas sp.]